MYSLPRLPTSSAWTDLHLHYRVVGVAGAHFRWLSISCRLEGVALIAVEKRERVDLMISI